MLDTEPELLPMVMDMQHLAWLQQPIVVSVCV